MVLLTLPEAAGMYRIPARTLRQRVASAHLHNYGTIGRPRYRADQLEPLGRPGYMPRLPVAFSDLLPAHRTAGARIPAA